MSLVLNGTTGVSQVQPAIVTAAGLAPGAVEGAMGSAFAFRNKIINGNFDYWQRATSLTAAATAGRYCADRWRSNAVGSTIAISQQAFTLGQTDVPNEPIYFHRSVVVSSAGATNFANNDYWIESVRTFAGKTITLSFYAKADSNRNIGVEFSQFFGTGGSPSGEIGQQGLTVCALTTNWKKFVVTTNIQSIGTKTLGSTGGTDTFILHFWYDAGSNWAGRAGGIGQQSGTFDIAQVQLEEGSVATPFESRPYQIEFALCQRYYQGNTFLSNCGNSAGTYVGGAWALPVQMRATPTLVFKDLASNASKVSLGGVGNNIALTGGNISASASAIQIDGTVGSSFSSWVRFVYTLDAEF